MNSSVRRPARRRRSPTRFRATRYAAERGTAAGLLIEQPRSVSCTWARLRVDVEARCRERPLLGALAAGRHRVELGGAVGCAAAPRRVAQAERLPWAVVGVEARGGREEPDAALVAVH